MVDTATFMNNGMLSSREPSLFELQTQCKRVGPQSTLFGNRLPAVQRDQGLAPPILNNVIDYSMRNVVPSCDTSLIHKVLRREPQPNAGSMVPQGGIGRGQERGLVWDSSHPLNVPIMPFSCPFASGLNNPLGHPD